MKLVDVEQVYCADCDLKDKCAEIICDVHRMPTINPSDLIPKGRWELTEDGDWACTRCGEAVSICVCGKDRTYRKPHCPNCGAKMEE